MHRAAIVLASVVTLAACVAPDQSEEEGASDSAVSAGQKVSIRQLLRNDIADRMKNEKLATPAYFFVGFGYEGVNNPASKSHTFASFVRVVKATDGPGAGTTKGGLEVVHERGFSQEWQTISWLPDTFEDDQTICIFENWGEAAKWKLSGSPCTPVKGENYNLTQTLGWALAANNDVGVWGPYAITQELYELGQERARFLNSGTAKYLADDTSSRQKGGPATAFNCMHAVSDLPGHFMTMNFFDKLDYGNWGIEGTLNVMDHYASFAELAPGERIAPRTFRRFSNR